MSRSRILITGAAGFTGRHAVTYFSEQGAEVTAVLRQPERKGASEASLPIFPQGVKVYYCDLSDRQAVAQMVEDTTPEDVLHLAGKNSVPESWQNPQLYMESNVMASLYILEALRSHTSSRVLVVGSRLKYRIGAGLPPHPYSLSKTVQELVALAWQTLFKQHVLVAEPCNLMGPGPSNGFCSLLASHIVRSEKGVEQQPFKLSSRFALRDFLDVRDAVRAYEYILRKGNAGTIYRVESGIERELGEVTRLLLDASSARIPVDWGLEAEGSPKQQSELNPPDHLTSEVNATDLGWQSGIAFKQSLSDILDYFRMDGEGGIV